MSQIKAGDIVRVKDRLDWPSPPGYKLNKSEGQVASVNEEQGFVAIRLVKTDTDIPNELPIDTTITLRLENVEVI
jgi:hypothetical protein